MHLAHHKAEHNEKGYGPTGSLHRAPKHRLMLLPSTMTASYDWYPNGFGTIGALRMGNCNLRADVAGNDAGHGVPDPRSNP